MYYVYSEMTRHKQAKKNSDLNLIWKSLKLNNVKSHICQPTRHFYPTLFLKPHVELLLSTTLQTKMLKFDNFYWKWASNYAMVAISINIPNLFWYIW